jgi:hypothetical protein
MVEYFNMKDSKQLSEGLNEIRSVANNGSWFKDTPHYWAEAWAPLAYAVACVEVVCKSSEKAEIVHNKPVVLQVGLYLLTTGQT